MNLSHIKVAKPKHINKSKSEIFENKLNQSPKQQIQSNECAQILNESTLDDNNQTPTIRRRLNVDLNHSSPKLVRSQTTIINNKNKINGKIVDSIENILRDNFELNDRITNNNLRIDKSKSNFYRKKFFIPSDKSDSTGSTDDDDNNNEVDLVDNNDDIYNAKINKELTNKIENVYLQEDDYDLNDEGDLSDSDQTESCILNDANNNDLLEYADNIETSNKKFDGAILNSGIDLEPLNDENNNEKQIKKLRSVCVFKFQLLFQIVLSVYCF